jgi:phage I-like protein
MKSGILRPITNRAETTDKGYKLPEDGWYHLAPLGEFLHGESKRIQVIDEVAVRSMVEAFPADGELLIDFEHESHDMGKRTAAAGWIQELQQRPDGLWMRPRWSSDGEAALRGGVYRFISPVWINGDCEELDGARIRPRKLHDAGLTNSPNLKGLVPLSNRSAEAEKPAAKASEKQTNKEVPLDHKAALLKLLGLPPEATDEQITAALSGATENMKQGKSYADLQNRYNSLLEQQAEADLDAAGITGDSRASWKKQLTANREGTLPLLADLVKNNANKTVATMTNRSQAKTPGQETKKPGTETKSKAQLQREAIATEKMANRSLSNEQAYHLAKAKNPEAFAPETEE